MLVYLENAYQAQHAAGKMQHLSSLCEAIIQRAMARVRPIMMTTTTTVIGLLPIMTSTGSGSQVMKRIAAPMVGGLISATILVLIVIPVVFTIWKGWGLREKHVA